MPTTIVVMQKGHDRDKMMKHLERHAPSWRPVEGLPRHFIIEGMHHTAFPHHPSVEGVHDGDDIVKSCVQTLTLNATLDQDNWGLARIIRRKTPWSDARITSPLSSYFYCNRSGNGVDYYSLDSGILTTHDEFSGRATSVYDVFGAGGADGAGHGTGTASIACGSTVGLARSALIWSFRCLDNNESGSVSGIITAMGQVLSHYNSRASTNRPAVVNMSFIAGAGAFDSAVADMIDAGMVCIAAAGNNKQDLSVNVYSPACTVDVITVGGVLMNDHSYFESGFGTNYGTPIDISAPSYLIKTAYKGGDSVYHVWSGTSFASPHVAGVVACMLEGYGRLTNRTQVQNVASKLYNNATTGYVVSEHGLTLPDKLAYIDPNARFETINGLTPGTTQKIFDSLDIIEDTRGVGQNRINDTLTFTETLVRTGITNVSVSESITFTETVYRTDAGVATDTVVFSDTMTGENWIFVDISEAVTLVETLTRQFLAVRTVGEALVFSELAQRSIIRLISFADTLTFSENNVAVLTKLISETLTFSETLQNFVAKLLRDTVEFGDILAINGSFVRQTADVFEPYDAVQLSLYLRRALSDTLVFTDTVRGTRTTPISESIAFTELTNYTTSKYATDTLTLSELMEAAKVRNFSISETLVFTDISSVNLVIKQALTDSLSLLEVMTSLRCQFFDASDTVTFNDNVVREIRVALAPDILTLLETITGTKYASRGLSEVLTFAETIFVNTVLKRALSDAITFGEHPPTNLVPNINYGAYGVVADKNMLIVGQTKSIVLPPPEFNDFATDRNQVIFKRKMMGDVSTYIKTCQDEKLHYEFVISRPKALEFRSFLDAENGNNMIIYDWKGGIWSAKLFTDTVERSEVGRWEPSGNKTRVTVEFIGKRYASNNPGP